VTDKDLIKALFHTHCGYQKDNMSIKLLGEVAPSFDFEKCSEDYYYRRTTFETDGHLISKVEGNDFICRSNGLKTTYGYLVVNFLISGTVTGMQNGEKVSFDANNVLTQNFIWTGDCDVELKYENTTFVSLFYNYTPNSIKIDCGHVTNQLVELLKSYIINREALVRLAAQEFGNEIVLNLLTATIGQEISLLKSFSYAALQDTAANNGHLKNYAFKSKISVSTASRALFHGKSVTKLLKKLRNSND
jgi:hypothetical protein